MGSTTSAAMTRWANSVDTPAGEPAASREVADRAARNEAAADGEVGGAAGQRREHARQHAGVVLQVGVHHGEVGRIARQHALDAGPGKPAPAVAQEAAHAGIAAAKLAHGLGGAVGRVVVDEDRLPGDAGERAIELLDEPGDVLALVEGRDDDRQIGGQQNGT